MYFSLSYKNLEEIYSKHLMVVNEIKFTFREVDLLACIINKKGDKKIASILSISPRTVNTHVYNIMSKIGVNSKDQVIDFIENSEKLSILKEYYLCVRIRAIFEKYLFQIRTDVNKKILELYCRRDDSLNVETQFFQSIKKHFRLANLIISDVIDSPQCSSNSNEKINYLYIDRITEKNYYHDILNQISEILNSDVINEIISQFNIEIEKIQNEHNNLKTSISDKSLKDQKQNIKKKLTKKRIILILGSVFLGLLIWFSADVKLISYIKQDEVLNYNDPPKEVKNLEELLISLKDNNFSANNTTPEQIKLNHSLAKQVDKLLAYQNMQEVKQYFDNSEMPSELLVNYVYNLQALSSYYMYNMHDGDRAKKILLHGKEILEHCINSRSSIKNNFDKLSAEEIIPELQIIAELPEIYTRLLYSLARTYFYKGIDMDQSRKYFELVRYLGLNFGLFEGYLGVISGSLIIENKIVDTEIREGQIDSAQKRIRNIIDAYKEMTLDSTSYILNYKPGAEVQETIVPTKSHYNQLECLNRIIGNYNKLLALTNKKEEVQFYIEELNIYIKNFVEHLVRNDLVKKSIFELTSKIPAKKVAVFCNTIGNLMVNIWILQEEFNVDINLLELQKEIAETLDIKFDNNLINFAEEIFVKAKKLSRNSEFAKADAYECLAKVYQLKLERYGASMEAREREILQENIKSSIEQSEVINTQLHRTDPDTIMFFRK